MKIEETARLTFLLLLYSNCSIQEIFSLVNLLTSENFICISISVEQ